MKIKGAVITGLVLIALGVGVSTYAASRVDFELDKIIDEENLSPQTEIFNNHNIKSINYDGVLDYMSIKYSPEVEDIQIKYTTSSMRSYTFEEVDDTLNIKQKFKTKLLMKSIYVDEDTDSDIKFEVVVPYELNTVNIDLDCGYIVSEDLNVLGDYVIELNAGYINSSNTYIENALFDVDAGYINSVDANVNNGLFEVSAGYIKYNGKITNSFNANVDAGYIEIRLSQEKELFKVNGNGTGDININFSTKCGYSNIKYNQ